jgi:dipeptidyl aminopeptidase/acylaminoacyl peptidase
LKDIQKLLEFINDNLSDSVDLSKICLMAHSRGGLSAIAYCAQQAQIRKLITLSSVADISRMWGNYDLEKWKKEGIVYSKNARTAEEMPMKYSLVQDYLSHENLFNPLKAAKKIKIPWLALHGSEDQAVPISEWESLKLSQPNLVSEVIRGADHTLGGKHPWTTNQLPEQCEFAMNIVADFILKNS